MAYTNSPLANQSESLRVKHYTKGRTYNGKTYRIDTITIHQIWGHMTNQQLANYFNSLPSSSGASSNYTVADDGSIGLLVNESDRSWATERVNDYRGITIEVATDREYPYKCTDKAIESIINLCADVCKRNGINKIYWIPEKNLTLTKQANLKANEAVFTIHEWFPPYKACPGDYIKGKLEAIAEAVNMLIAADIRVGDKVEMEVYEIKDGYAYGKVKVEEPAPAPKTIKVGSKVTINPGAKAGGLSSTRGKAIRPEYANGKYIDTVNAIETHKGVEEARLQGIITWVALTDLTLVG